MGRRLLRGKLPSRVAGRADDSVHGPWRGRGRGLLRLRDDGGGAGQLVRRGWLGGSWLAGIPRGRRRVLFRGGLAAHHVTFKCPIPGPAQDAG